MQNKGLFITFEGVEGSGKTETSKRVATKLKQLGYNVIVTREPGGTPLGEKIRELILYNEMEDTTEALLFAAARAQHYEEKILPAINKGTIVLCDRWLSSSLAYQGWARSLGVGAVEAINDFGIRGFRPDAQFFIDVTPEEGFKRVQQRNSGTDRLEQENLQFHNDVYYQFNSECEECDYIYRINGLNSLEDITDEVTQIILTKILGQ